MKKVATLMVIILVLAGTALPACAIDRWGKVNNIYSYDDLSIKDNRNGTCSISIEFKNNDRKMHEAVFITIYGYDNFNGMLWKKLFSISAIQAGGTVNLSETIQNCQKDNPYRIEFKVTE